MGDNCFCIFVVFRPTLSPIHGQNDKPIKTNSNEKDLIIRIGAGGGLRYAVVRERPETR